MNNATEEHWSKLIEEIPTIERFEIDLEEDDPVNSPSHYKSGSIECIEAIEESMSPEAYRGYLKGNCMKYLWRYTYKSNPVEDLQKAQWYLAKLVSREIWNNGD